MRPLFSELRSKRQTILTLTDKKSVLLKTQEKIYVITTSLPFVNKGEKSNKDTVVSDCDDSLIVQYGHSIISPFSLCFQMRSRMRYTLCMTITYNILLNIKLLRVIVTRFTMLVFMSKEWSRNYKNCGINCKIKFQAFFMI